MKSNYFPSRIFVKTFYSCLIFFACITAARAQITPHLDCVEPLAYDNAGAITQYRAWFGYENRGTTPVTINDGPNNFFTPNPNGQFSGQQTNVFQPGYQRRTFSITVTVSSTLKLVSWLVQNRPASTSLNPASFCDNGTQLMTYQGRLTVSGAAANQPHDFEFRFYDNQTGGTEMQPRLYAANVPVTNGVFTTQIDIGQVFTKGVVEGKWMQIGVRKAGTTGAYETLTPRQQLTAAPFAVNARNVSGGFVQIPVNNVNIGNSPWTCDDAKRGQIFLSSNNTSATLYVCTTTGWKSVALQ